MRHLAQAAVEYARAKDEAHQYAMTVPAQTPMPEREPVQTALREARERLLEAAERFAHAAIWNENDCLAYDPFAGDDYGGGFVDFGAKIVTGRGDYECHICRGSISPGDRHRVDSCILDGERLHARFCGHCCAAMAKAGQDGGEAIEAREPSR